MPAAEILRRPSRSRSPARAQPGKLSYASSGTGTSLHVAGEMINIEGKVAMDVNYSLERWELDAGYVLTCQSRPTTPKVVLDYDQM